MEDNMKKEIEMIKITAEGYVEKVNMIIINGDRSKISIDMISRLQIFRDHLNKIIAVSNNLIRYDNPYGLDISLYKSSVKELFNEVDNSIKLINKIL